MMDIFLSMLQRKDSLKQLSNLKIKFCSTLSVTQLHAHIANLAMQTDFINQDLVMEDNHQFVSKLLSF